MRIVNANELEALRKGGVEHALFDVREAGEAHRGHVFGSSFLPRRQIELRIGALVPSRATPITLVDAGNGDRRAQRAAATLARLGYASVGVLEGGTTGWTASGRTLAEGSNVPSKLFGEQVHEGEQVPRLPVQDLHRWQSEGRAHTVCDIRSPEEYARSRIPGARGAFGTELALLAADLRELGHPVIVHCSGRTRSIIACQTLRLLGVPQAYALENGTMGWQLAGYELERGAPAGVLAASAISAAWGREATRTLALQAGAQSLPHSQLQSWLHERAAGRTNVYPLDVRQVARYTEGHLPGSLAVPGGLAIQRADEFAPIREARVVFIDDGEARAWLAAYWYRRMGFAHVYVLEGGLEAWTAAGLPLEAGRGRSGPAGWDEARAHTTGLSPSSLAAMAGAVVIDVDTSQQHAQARVMGARWMRYGDLEDRVADMESDARHRLVLTCRDGVLSTLAAANLAREGLIAEPVRVLEGGVKAWRDAGLPVDAGADAQAGPADDLVVQPYDSGREGMQRYLDWEQKLTARHAH